MVSVRVRVSLPWKRTRLRPSLPAEAQRALGHVARAAAAVAVRPCRPDAPAPDAPPAGRLGEGERRPRRLVEPPADRRALGREREARQQRPEAPARRAHGHRRDDRGPRVAGRRCPRVTVDRGGRGVRRPVVALEREGVAAGEVEVRGVDHGRGLARLDGAEVPVGRVWSRSASSRLNRSPAPRSVQLRLIVTKELKATVAEAFVQVGRGLARPVGVAVERCRPRLRHRIDGARGVRVPHQKLAGVPAPRGRTRSSSCPATRRTRTRRRRRYPGRSAGAALMGDGEDVLVRALAGEAELGAIGRDLWLVVVGDAGHDRIPGEVAAVRGHRVDVVVVRRR